MKIIFTLLGVSLIIFFLIKCKNKSSEKRYAEKSLSEDTSSKIPQEFMDLLFADQKLAEISKIISSNPPDDSVWNQIKTAEALVNAGKKEEAIKILTAITALDSIEARSRIWAWNGLRELNILPAKLEVLGLILEVPLEEGTEYLAIYSDKTARFVNYAGTIAVWDEREHTVDSLINSIILASERHLATAPGLQQRNKLPTDKVRFNFLTNKGICQEERRFEELSGESNSITHIFVTATGIMRYVTEAAVNRP